MEVQPHHIKTEPCFTRPRYRDSKKPKNVIVYTCAQESKYLLVMHVPSIEGATDELKRKFGIYGKIADLKTLYEYPNADQFTDTVLIQFERIQNAR